MLAGGVPQIALLQELRRRGIETVLADWYERPVAAAYADRFYQVSTLDVEAITELARREKVDLVLTVCTDQALLTMAIVSERLGLPCYLDSQTARNVTDKLYMKRIFARTGVPTADFEILCSPADRDAAAERLGYPLIVKPTDCNSSKGVKRVDAAPALGAAVEQAAAMSRTGGVLMERFLQGDELSVDAYVADGRAYLLGISDIEKLPDRDGFVIFRCSSPSRHEALAGQIRHIAQQIADGFGLRDAPMLIQLVTDGEQVWVLEFSARTGGGCKHASIRELTGFDVVSAVVDLTLGQKPPAPGPMPSDRWISLEFLYCRPGRFDRLDGFEPLKQAGVMKDYYVFKWRGAQFDTIENSGDRVAGFMITADTEEELARRHDRIASSIRVLDDAGRDMLRHDLLPPFYEGRRP